MASYHFSAQIIGRAKGRSAIAAAAYRAGELLRDEQTGAEHDFTRRQGVVHTEIMLPAGAAPWLADRQTLWNHVHQIETRKDAQLCREINLALPHELSADGRRTLLQDFVREQFVARGMVADLAIHAPTDNDPRNHHAHVMLTLRKATPDGLYRVKTREWNSDATLNGWRAAWADWQNRVLAQAHHPERVDHRTLAVQREEARGQGDRLVAEALDREPEIHIGPRAQNAVRRGAKPRSYPRTTTTARPQAGSWRSSTAPDKRQRIVDYVRIDDGPRAVFNARRSAAGAEATARCVDRLRHRNARLRLMEVRYLKALRAAIEGLRAVQRDRKRSVWQRPDAAQLAWRETYFRERYTHAFKRSQLIRLLLGRADRILAGLFQVQQQAFTRSRILDERLLPRFNGSDRGSRHPGRSRDVFSPAGP